MSLKNYAEWHKIYEAQMPLEELPQDIQDIVSSVKELAKKIVFKGTKKYSEKMRAVNLFIYVQDRESDSAKIFEALKKEGKKPTTNKTSLSSFPATEIVYAGKIIRLIYKPAAGGKGESTLNAAITELGPVLLFNSGKTITPDPDGMLQIMHETLNLDRWSTGILAGDMGMAKTMVDSFDGSSRYSEKMINAYAIYKWVKDYENRTSPIESLFWAPRTKPAGVPPKSAADIVIKHTKDAADDLLGVSLKAGSRSSAEPLLNTSLMQCVRSLYPTLEKKIIKTVWDEIYKPIVDDYNSNSGKILDVTMDNFYRYNNAKIKTTNILAILDWFESNNKSGYLDKYNQMQDILKDVIMEVVNKNGRAFNDWLAEKMNVADTFPLIVVKAVKNTAHEVKSASAGEMAALLHDEIITLEKHPSDKSFLIHKLNDGSTMTFQLRSSKGGSYHMLGSFYNLSFYYKGRK